MLSYIYLQFNRYTGVIDNTAFYLITPIGTCSKSEIFLISLFHFGIRKAVFKQRLKDLKRLDPLAPEFNEVNKIHMPFTNVAANLLCELRKVTEIDNTVYRVYKKTQSNFDGL